MVKWGYGSIVKIATKQSNLLIISVQKSATFQEVFDAFEIARDERRKIFAEKKEAERATAVMAREEAEAETTSVKVAEAAVEDQ